MGRTSAPGLPPEAGRDPTEEHAVLSPSSSERWISCPASVALIRQLEHEHELPPASTYAAEGTAAHALAFITAKHRLQGLMTDAEYGRALFRWRQDYHAVVEDEAEMSGYVGEYLEFLAGQLDAYGSSVLLLEQRVPTGVPSCWGTSDAVVVSPQVVHITDLKYGRGVEVSAESNPQTRLYGVGALEAFGDLLGEVDEVRMSIYQPRIGNITTEALPANELREWRDKIIPIAEEALGPAAHFGPSEKACRWCPAAGNCRAQLEWAIARDFSVVPENLTPTELQAALDAIPFIESWCSAVKSHALDLIYNKGGDIPGYKAVVSNGKRYIADEQGALEALQLIGYELNEVVNQKIKGIGELERILGRNVFAHMMRPYVSKSAGSISLAAETDARPAANPNTEAARVFAEVNPQTELE